MYKLQMSCFLLLAPFAQAQADPPTLQIFAREALVDALDPLIERRAEVFEVVVQSGTSADFQLLERADYLLLVGDDAGAGSQENWSLPAPRAPLYRWIASQAVDYGSDVLFGDRDGDGRPDLPVGRFPARTPEDVAAAVRKTLAYEDSLAAGFDLDRGDRLVIWAGAPGYGELFDRMATGLLVSVLNSKLPHWSDCWVISADAGSALSHWPPAQANAFEEELRRGSLISVLLGHGSVESFFSQWHDGQALGYTDMHAKLAFATGAPTAPMFVFTCDSGNFAAENPCLTEALFAAPGGPVAVVGATTQSHPLTNYYSQTTLLESLDQGSGPVRLGDLWWSTQQRSVGKREFLMEKTLKDIEGSLEEEIDVAALQSDQERMYALLGDPTLALVLPRRLQLETERMESGKVQWRLSEVPEGVLGGTVTWRRSNVFPPTRPTDAEELECRTLFDRAQELLSYRELTTIGAEGPFQGEVDAQSGRLRVSLQLADGWAVGVADS